MTSVAELSQAIECGNPFYTLLLRTRAERLSSRVGDIEFLSQVGACARCYRGEPRNLEVGSDRMLDTSDNVIQRESGER